MEWYEALVLGIVQGLTEFLPVSSSGHIEIGKALFGISGGENLYFSIVVHGATVLSTIVVLRKEIFNLFAGLFKFKLNEETNYILKILVSMIPVAIVGIFLKDVIKVLFDGSALWFIGSMLLVTSLILWFTSIFKSKEKDLSFFHAFIIGVAQAIAVIPGISRSGATIATGLILGNRKEEIAKFSFLMVLIPILGENFLDIISGNFTANANMPISSLLIGFISAFVVGLFACSFMLQLVKRGKLWWFAIYCAIVGILTIVFL